MSSIEETTGRPPPHTPVSNPRRDVVVCPHGGSGDLNIITMNLRQDDLARCFTL